MSIRKYIAIITLLTTVLLFSASYSYAQNTADDPYIDSWHRYSVDMSDTGNTPSWELIGGASGPHTLSDALPWVSIGQSGTTINVDIKFINTLFNDGENWSLIYSETTPVADGECVALRELPITIFDNTFYLDMVASPPDCNSYSAYVWDNDDGNLSLTPRVDTVDFEVIMYKAANFDINSWYFNGVITVTGGHNLHSSAIIYQPSTRETLIQNDTWNIDPASLSGEGTQSGTFKLTVTTGGSGNLSDIVRIRVLVEGDITSDFGIQLELGAGGTATSGSSFITLTDDNLDGTRTTTKTIRGVPNTSVVTVTP